MRIPHVRRRIHALWLIGAAAALWLAQAAVVLAEGAGAPYPR